MFQPLTQQNIMNWNSHVNTLTQTLNLLSARNGLGGEIPPDTAFAQWRDLTFLIREARRSVYFIGNGASASIASHMSADLAKNAHVRTEVFSDLSLITALANDLCYEEVFAEPLRRRMEPGDMLVAISSSGKSPNILRASQVAAARGGIVVTLSSMDGSNSLRSKGMLNFYVPAHTYGMAESGHAALLHFWVDLMVESTEQRPQLKSDWETMVVKLQQEFGPRSAGMPVGLGTQS